MKEIKYDELLELLKKSNIATTAVGSDSSYSFNAVINNVGCHTAIVHPNEQRIEIKELEYIPNADICMNVSNTKIHILPHEDSHVVQQLQGHVSLVPYAPGGMPVNDNEQLELEASEAFIRSINK